MGKHHAKRKKQETKRQRRADGRPPVRTRAGAPVGSAAGPTWLDAQEPVTASEALLTVAVPLLEGTRPDAGRADYELAMRLAQLAWNCAVSGRIGDETWELLVEGLGLLLDDAELGVALGAVLVQRKHALYPHDRRLILDVHVGESEDGYHVSAASTWRVAAP
jgi:hypothetical protein